MITRIDEDTIWETVQKADRLLNRLPAEQIAYLGDGFPWAVTEDDVVIARRSLKGARVGAIQLGFEIAQLAAREGAVREDIARGA
ncbi:hypothetical protein CLV49_1528 [Labedella gwakjiensis]|uniref:Uncharacterized protein n=1 Tax=Labedella gwakjiensis TaxID=390269 RepID=A0A2P8GVC3_9MICO|nr:hypothetical protein [Labedella gwakjiensis]PSL37920.1 hypothetical protein CLV49_1528 [Labedella gwakjiensis]RUQ87513.1 hypothetical protein ELQ93_11555 [Labedella gwakjiensis]